MDRAERRKRTHNTINKRVEQLKDSGLYLKQPIPHVTYSDKQPSESFEEYAKRANIKRAGRCKKMHALGCPNVHCLCKLYRKRRHVGPPIKERLLLDDINDLLRELED